MQAGRHDPINDAPSKEESIGPKSGFHFWVRYKRLLWFVLLYLASLAAFAAMVYGLKLIVPR